LTILIERLDEFIAAGHTRSIEDEICVSQRLAALGLTVHGGWVDKENTLLVGSDLEPRDDIQTRNC